MYSPLLFTTSSQCSTRIFNTSLVEITWFRLEKFIQPSSQCCISIERNSAHSIWKRSKEVEIHWCQIGRVRRVWQHFPAMRLNGFLGHIGDMRAGVIVQQKNSMLPIRSFLLNSRVESFHLLNIEFRVDRLVPFKQFVMDNSFPPYAQYRFTRMKILFHARSLVCRG